VAAQTTTLKRADKDAAELAEMKQSKVLLEHRLGDAEGALGETREEVRRWRGEAEAALDGKREMQAILREFEPKLQELEARVADHVAREAALEDGIGGLNAQREIAQQLMSELQAKCQGLEKELAEARWAHSIIFSSPQQHPRTRALQHRHTRTRAQTRTHAHHHHRHSHHHHQHKDYHCTPQLAIRISPSRALTCMQDYGRAGRAACQRVHTAVGG
jgi:chromosome segregation ATPase